MQMHTLTNAHQSFISSIKFNPNNINVLASSCIFITVNNNLANDSYVKIWNLNDELISSHIYDYKIHLYGINQIKWNNNGNMLASAGNDCAVNVVDVNKQKLIRNFRIESPVTCLDFNYSSNLILFGTFDKQIILFDMRSKNLISQILAHSEPITSVSFSHDSTIMISSSYDGFIRIWDTFKGNCLKTIVLEKSPPINKVSFLPDPNFILLSAMNNQIQILDLFKEEEIIKYTGHESSNYLIDQCLFTDDNNNTFLISGSEDTYLYRWNVLEGGEGTKIGQLRQFYSNDHTIVNSLDINKNGVLAAAAYPYMNIHFLNI